MINSIYLTSDLHDKFDIKNQVVPDDADVIVIAGDLQHPEAVFDHFTPFGKPIIAVAGNHDVWGGDIFDRLDELRALAAQYDNVHFLENDTVIIGDTRFIGSTLWTNYGNWNPRLALESSFRIADHFKINAQSWWSNPDNQLYAKEKLHELVIKFTDIDDHCASIIRRDWTLAKLIESGKFHPIVALWMNERALQFIKDTLATEFDGKTVVVTHHPPTLELARRKYAGLNEVDLHQFDDMPYDPHQRMNLPKADFAMEVAAYGNPYEPLFSELVFMPVGYNRKQIQQVGGLLNFDLWLHGHTHVTDLYSFMGKRFAVRAMADFYGQGSLGTIKIQSKASDDAVDWVYRSAYYTLKEAIAELDVFAGQGFSEQLTSRHLMHVLSWRLEDLYHNAFEALMNFCKSLSRATNERPLYQDRLIKREHVSLWPFETPLNQRPFTIVDIKHDDNFSHDREEQFEDDFIQDVIDKLKTDLQYLRKGLRRG